MSQNVKLNKRQLQTTDENRYNAVNKAKKYI